MEGGTDIGALATVNCPGNWLERGLHRWIQGRNRQEKYRVCTCRGKFCLVIANERRKKGMRACLCGCADGIPEERGKKEFVDPRNCELHEDILLKGREFYPPVKLHPVRNVARSSAA